MLTLSQGQRGEEALQSAEMPGWGSSGSGISTQSRTALTALQPAAPCTAQRHCMKSSSRLNTGVLKIRMQMFTCSFFGSLSTCASHPALADLSSICFHGRESKRASAPHTSWLLEGCSQVWLPKLVLSWALHLNCQNPSVPLATVAEAA